MEIMLIPYSIELLFYIFFIIPKYKYLGENSHIANRSYKHIRTSIFYFSTCFAFSAIILLIQRLPLWVKLLANSLLILLPCIFEYLFLCDAKSDATNKTFIDELDDSD